MTCYEYGRLRNYFIALEQDKLIEYHKKHGRNQSMLDKYIKINDKQIIAGQNSSGVWYCKELPANTTSELDQLISIVNSILNKYNSEVDVKKKPKTIE